MTEKEDNEIAERKKHDDSNTSLVKSLIDSFRDAFNNHDPKKLASLLVEDGEWTGVIGTTMVGRLEIEQQYTYPFQSVLKEATLNVTSFRNKWIKDNIVSIDIRWESTGHQTPQGDHIPTIRYGLLNIVAEKINNGGKDPILRIVLAHNNDYTSTFTQKDRKKVVDKFKQ
jgi:uncharacterized protein (TIGR02246 family)